MLWSLEKMLMEDVLRSFKVAGPSLLKLFFNIKKDTLLNILPLNILSNGVTAFLAFESL